MLAKARRFVNSLRFAEICLIVSGVGLSLLLSANIQHPPPHYFQSLQFYICVVLLVLEVTVTQLLFWLRARNGRMSVRR